MLKAYLWSETEHRNGHLKKPSVETARVLSPKNLILPSLQREVLYFWPFSLAMDICFFTSTLSYWERVLAQT